MESKRKLLLTQEEVIDLLDSIYEQINQGLGKVSPPIGKMAEDYLKKAENNEDAATKMIKNQVWKCTTSGFITGFGGIIMLPVAVPANLGSVLYVQMRMIACVAYLAGYDLSSDQVQTLVYACLAGISVNSIFKNAGIKFGNKVAVNMIKKVPGKTLTKINQKVGFRFVTKFGEKGIINMGKLVPGVGAIIGGSFDFVETKAIGDRAYKWFFQNDFTVPNTENDDDIALDISD